MVGSGSDVKDRALFDSIFASSVTHIPAMGRIMSPGWLMLLAIIILCPPIAFAGRPLVVDDARAVAEGYFEVEMGLSGSHSDKGGRELRLPVMGLTYGLLKGLEVGLNIQRVDSDAGGEAPTRGFQDLHLATKYNFLEEALYPALAFSFDLKIPTAGRRKGLGSGRFDENFLFIATKHFFPLAIDLNLGYLNVDSPPQEKLKDRFLGGLALRYGLSERWRLVGEIVGQSREAKGEKNEANFQIGVRYRPNLPVFFDAAIGRSLRPSGTRIQGILGLTWSYALNF